jgi:mutator protein MutT
MKKNRFKITPSVAVIIRQEEKILLIKRSGTGWYDEHYALPAGRIEEGESVFKAAIREVYEEVGIALSDESLTICHVTYEKSENWVCFVLEATRWEGRPSIKEPHKCTHLEWFSINNLPEKSNPYLKLILEKLSKKDFFSEK